MSIKLLFSCALLVIALTSFVVAPPPPPLVDPSKWHDLRTSDLFGHQNLMLWYRVFDKDRPSQRGREYEVIHFLESGIVNQGTVQTHFVTKEREQCHERKGIIPQIQYHSYIHLENKDQVRTSTLSGFWALTDHFNPQGELIYSAETRVIQTRKQGETRLEVRYVNLENKPKFSMMPTCRDATAPGESPVTPHGLVLEIRFNGPHTHLAPTAWPNEMHVG